MSSKTMFGNGSEIQVTYACGHQESIKSQRDFINEMRTRAARRTLCEVCLGAHRAKRDCMISNSVQRTKEAAAATKLTGTRKQIEWAERIREKWLFIVKREIPTHLLSNLEKARIGAVSPEAIEQATTTVLAARLAAIDGVVAHCKAAWWIDFQSYLEAMVNQPTDAAIKSECSVLLNR
ncbi:hypothetical protein [Bradyrhizobium sp. LMG 9283]|uniref:hypothetical protein n=1 Tax=Bradyrhizobium sp. LMG 9283 TaxID=592064 RepID=UPI00388E017E